MIYAVYVNRKVTEPIKLCAYKATKTHNEWVCEERLITTNRFTEEDFGKELCISSGSVFYYIDKLDAIAKYNAERDRRIEICTEQIKDHENCILYMQNFDPYGIPEVLRGEVTPKK